MSRKLVLFLSVFGMVLAGCAKSQTSPPELVEGVDYIEGAAEVPEGKYLLVEFITEIKLCWPHEMRIDFPFYEYEDGILSGSAPGPNELIIGYFGQYTTPAPGSGFGVSSELKEIRYLPFHGAGAPVTVLSIDSDGTVVADVNGEVVKLKAGKGWSYTDLGEACDKRGNERYIHRFVNQGFLTEDQIDFDR